MTADLHVRPLPGGSSASADEARERGRLAALERYHILDTAPEPVFERLAALAARMFGTRFAVVSLVDRDRQWFKAHHGLQIEETSRSSAFCAHTIRAGVVTVVEDARRDPTFAKNPLVTEAPAIRFYAGAPLATSDGYCIGTIAIFDPEPKTLSPGQAGLLQELAAMAVDALELRLFQRERAVAAAREAEKSAMRLQTILDRSRAKVFEFDADGTYLNVWAADESLLVAPARTLIGRKLRDALPPVSAQLFEDVIARALATGRRVTFEYELDVAVGHGWFVADAAPMPAPPGERPRVAIVASDITAQKTREEELRVAVERFEIVARATNDAVWDWNLDTGRMWWNPGFYTLFGYERAGVEEDIRFWKAGVHPEDLPAIEASLHRVIGQGGASWSAEYRFRRADGTWADVHDRGYLMRDESGRAARMIGAMTDVSIPRQAARAQVALTRVAEAAAGARGLSDLLRSIHEIVATLLPAKNLFIALHTEGSDTVEYPYYCDERDPAPAGPEKLGNGLGAWVLRSGTPLLLSTPPEIDAFRRDHRLDLVGTPAQSWVGIPLVSNERSIGILVVQSYDASATYTARDQTILEFVSTQIAGAIERRHAEAKLNAADRMASIGTLAAGVAHEINNPLAFVIANLALMAEALPAAEGSGAREFASALHAAQEGAERVREIVRGLKTFSREGNEPGGPVDVQRALRSALLLAGNEIRHRGRLVEDHAAELPAVLGEEGKLSQVFLNLIVNAAQAIREGDTIRISTRREGMQVVVDVQDSGCGILPEHLPRLFDPFFTTKPVGVGTGLGLYICRNIVDSFGGSIQVDSAPGRGSRFRVLLPVAPGAKETPLLRAATPPAAAQRARILVVDDEPQIGSVLKRSLPAHDVSAVISAEEALQRLRGGEPFDLILCDLMMPQMTGMDLHAELLAGPRPGIAGRMVFLTGGAFTQRAGDFLDSIPNERIDKPFELQDLRARIDRLLERLGRAS